MQYAVPGRNREDVPDMKTYEVVSDGTVHGRAKGESLSLDSSLQATKDLVESGHLVLKKKTQPTASMGEAGSRGDS